MSSNVYNCSKNVYLLNIYNYELLNKLCKKIKNNCICILIENCIIIISKNHSLKTY